MKKNFLSFVLISAIALSAMAEKEGVFTHFHRTGNPSTNLKVDRAPMRFPSIDVSYDTDTKTIYVMSDESVEADVMVTDPSGMIIGYSDSINTTLYIGQCNSQIAILRIDGNGWYATAEITL